MHHFSVYFITKWCFPQDSQWILLLYTCSSSIKWLWNKPSFHICLDCRIENNMKMSNFSSTESPLPRTAVGELCGLSIQDAWQSMPVRRAWNISGSENKVKLNLKGPGGIRPLPLDVSRDNFVEIFFPRRALSWLFLWSLAQLLALFSEKSGVLFQSYATLCNRASAQNLKIFWICVQNIWTMAACAKTPFWALKCSICFYYTAQNLKIFWICVQKHMDNGCLCQNSILSSKMQYLLLLHLKSLLYLLIFSTQTIPYQKTIKYISCKNKEIHKKFTKQ